MAVEWLLVSSPSPASCIDALGSQSRGSPGLLQQVEATEGRAGGGSARIRQSRLTGQRKWSLRRTAAGVFVCLCVCVCVCVCVCGFRQLSTPAPRRRDLAAPPLPPGDMIWFCTSAASESALLLPFVSFRFFLVCKVLPGSFFRVCRCYWVFPNLVSYWGISWVRLGLTGFHWVSLGFKKFHRVLLGFTGFY